MDFTDYLILYLSYSINILIVRFNKPEKYQEMLLHKSIKATGRYQQDLYRRLYLNAAKDFASIDGSIFWNILSFILFVCLGIALFLAYSWWGLLYHVILWFTSGIYSIFGIITNTALALKTQVHYIRLFTLIATPVLILIVLFIFII